MRGNGPRHVGQHRQRPQAGQPAQRAAACASAQAAGAQGGQVGGEGLLQAMRGVDAPSGGELPLPERPGAADITLRIPEFGEHEPR